LGFSLAVGCERSADDRSLIHSVPIRAIENRKSKIENDLVTRVEFHQSLDAVRDRQTATFMAFGEKMDQNQKELIYAIAHQGVVTEQRLDHLETTVARLDERTKA